METCVRGFSFMPETKVEDLKYVESDALERTWRTARRERLKQQEQKIWEEFVNEQDIVHNISKEDPYQFLNELPQECIKELLDLELQKMRDEKNEDEIIEEHTEPHIHTTTSMVEELDNQHVLTLSEQTDRQECNMCTIFDDDKDDDNSGPDEEGLNDSITSPPCTVREKSENRPQTPENESPDKASSKSSGENVTNMIEGSIYCAKVKELRMKINEELLNMIGFLERQDIINMDPADIPKLMKRSVEFCARFNRVHMYQLQRQMADIERNSSNALPFAQRTHFQAQLVRISSLHQNLLHALQIFHKSLAQTACIKESGDMLRLVVGLVGEATRVCGDARPHTLAAAQDLFDDSVQSTCEKLEETANKYVLKMSDYLHSTENTSIPCSRRSSKLKGRKRSIGTWSKSGTTCIADTGARLSMYSLGVNARSTSSKDNQSSSGTSKMRANIRGGTGKQGHKEDKMKSPKKSPRSRRPLMRAPQRTHPRRVVPKEQDVHTLVENVAPCASSHISREPSLTRSPKRKNTAPQHKSKETTPRTARNKESSKTPIPTPRNKTNNITARSKTIADSPSKKQNNSRVTEKFETPRNVQDNVNCKVLVPNRNEMEDIKIQVRGGDKCPVNSPQRTEDNLRRNEEARRSERERNRAGDIDPTRCEVTRLVRQLCGGDNISGLRNERVVGAKNAQLLCVNGGSPRQPSTPQLLRILEETIQKKTPKTLFPKQKMAVKDAEKYRMNFNIPEQVTDALFQYRTKFVQHMLTSPMYANSAIGKPWETIGSVSEKIIDELLLKCAKEMELQHIVKQMYKNETC
ncbi:uncharacterized protein LOC123872538 [Maniola jurtina]|uniref:uncharacterized protein LOC123872538 n=1 Tax=Maniola jurtina TaxID=191418 RepID=UPI001E68DD00|nr:uncharacterized protein LOC123872538 [Maniola jurtina]